MAIIRKTLANGRVMRKGIVTKGNTCYDGTRGALTAGLNEAVTTLGDFVFMRETNHMTRRAIRAAKKARVRKHLATTADFQLHRGDVAFGKPKSMTGQEAWDLNRRYEDTFFCSNDPDARLWRWFPVGTLNLSKRVSRTEYLRLRLIEDLKSERK